ncbi:hypothetical protein TNCV_4000171 [Trichonephila clavipes]|nr:hypothetical protein TNCV_4000171 [Trichonephila clavipes]
MGLGSNHGKGRDVGKCVVPLGYEGTLNSRETASPLMSLVEGEESWKAFDNLQDIFPRNWGGTEPNRLPPYSVQSYS